MKYFFVLYVIFLISITYAQDFNNYQPLVSEGVLPDDFIKLTKHKVREDIKKATKDNTHLNSTKRDFYLQTNYFIDELLLSGKVLFNDPVTRYVNKVADIVLKEEPQMRSELRFYTLKSTIANAFATNQGIVFVTLGLLAQLENEAQLAFVLAHEIIHYKNKHVLNSYLEQEKIRKTSNKYTSYDSKIKMLSSYARSLETESDSLGLITFMRTGYNKYDALTSMDVLQFSHLPFNEKKFEPNFLECEHMKLPKALFLDSLKQPDVTSDDYDDSESTHPNIKKRRDAIARMIGNVISKKTIYLISEEEFKNVQKIARFESVRLKLIEREYQEAIYDAYLLLQDNPGNMYLEKSIAKALYAMSKYRNDGSIRSYKKIEGNLQQVFHVFYTLTPKQLSVLSAKYIYTVKEKYPNDEFIKNICRDHFITLMVNHKYVLSDFTDAKRSYLEYLNQQNNQNKDTVITHAGNKNNSENTDDDENSGKYYNLRKQKTKSVTKEIKNETDNIEKSKFHLLAFNDLLDNEDFKNYFHEQSVIAKKISDSNDENISYYEKIRREKEKDKEKVKPKKLGIDKIVLVDPYYYAVDSKTGVKLIDSEVKLVQYGKDVSYVASKAGLQVDKLAPKEFDANDIQRYNDMSLMNDWMNERMEHENKDIIPLECDWTEHLADRYNTRYFIYSGLFTYKQPREGKVGMLFIGIVSGYLFPYALYYIFTPEHYCQFYTLIFDVKNGDCLLSENISFSSKNSASYTKSMLYDIMLQIKNR